ncbi:MAG: ORF6N domain-containing protein [Prevotellaceae bacterium]|nr:ORF6N domain-containing protein [Prevotellaceae bacterium]
MFELTKDEHISLRSEFSTLEKKALRSKILILEETGRGKHSKYIPKAFTEKGLYMLATILKSPRATRTTIAIVETFSKIRELARTVAELSAAPEEFKQKSLIQKGGDIISDILGDDLQVSAAETKYEVNFALLKITHTVTKTSKTKSS